ncbi:MAG: glycosyltransferase family 39 protein [Candidatus Dormiibacterota bacterium]
MPDSSDAIGAPHHNFFTICARDAPRGHTNALDENTMSEIPPRMKRNLHIILPVALYLILRLPSLIEPQWYSDEAGYASTAWLTHAGYGLYVDAWNNKPPLLFGIYGLSEALFGASEAGIHALSILSGLAAIIAATWGMSRFFTTRAALWSGLAIAIIVGSPMLDGNLALPESLLIGPVTVAMVWFLCSCTDAAARRPRAVTLACIGLLFACGFLIQQTAIADFASVVLWCLVRRRWRTMLTVGGMFAITVAVVIVPFMLTSGAHNVWFALVTSYIDYVNDALGDRLPAYLVRIIIVLAIVMVAWLFRNAKDDRLELARIWVAALLFTAIAAGYAYEHFLLPVSIPLVMLVTGLASRHHDHLLQRIRRPRVLIAGALFAAITSAGGSLFVAGYRSAIWSVGYYANAISYVSGSISELDYDTYFDGLSYGEHEAEQWISTHNLIGVTAMLWTNLAWPLVDDDLLPPTRSGPLYVTLALEKGTAGIISRMNATPPELILISPNGIENLNDIRAFIRSHPYQEVMDAHGIELYVRSGG